MTTESLALARTEGKSWVTWQGDCVELMRGMPENSIDLTVTSIPFSTLFTYSISEHDFGNARSNEEFFEQFDYGVREWLRVTKPGRVCCTHLMNLPSSKVRDGHTGLIDFRGDVIKAYQRAGWIYTSEVMIRKSPVVAAQRTKALGLLYKQLRKDSTMSRMGIPDYIVMFRKPGDNAAHVTHTYDDFPLERWQQWAEPVWMDIDQSDTLSATSVREDEDERHLCVLQREPIRRCILMYSNPGDVIFDPFGGIGSTGVVALEMERRAVMCELKGTYYAQMVANLRRAETDAARPDLFSLAGGGAEP